MRPAFAALLFAVWIASHADRASFALVDEPPQADSPLVKLLKSGRIPEERIGSVFDMIGKRGKAADLSYLFDQVVPSEKLSPSNRVKALNALSEAASTRNLKPTGTLDLLAKWVADKDNATSLAAIKLSGLWKSEALGKPLAAIAANGVNPAQQAAALEALAAIGGSVGRAGIEALTTPDQPVSLRAMAVGALVKLDVDEASRKGVAVLQKAKETDFVSVIAPFLNRQGGADKLAEAIAQDKLNPDAAKLALRTVYTLGRSDAPLVNALTKAAGINAEVKPLDKTSMDALIADVARHGDAERGEAVFRRADVNCAKCHALSGAGGGVGPDLSPIGVTSPVDYLINSIMLPDQAIKEVYQTLIVQTEDGQVYQGVVVDKDDQRLILKDATGELRTIPAAEIEASKEGGSLMPKGLVNFMTRGEFVDLIRFLSELGKPGPYAIRSTPTIQRWLVLKDPAANLIKEVPDLKTFRTEVLDAPSENWASAYAKVAGALPLSEFPGASVVYLQGIVDVTHGDQVAVALDSPEGITAWVDDQPAPTFQANRFETTWKTGRHRLTFRVDKRSRKAATLRAEVLKGEGSSAEYVIAGGK